MDVTENKTEATAQRKDKKKQSNKDVSNKSLDVSAKVSTTLVWTWQLNVTGSYFKWAFFV